MKILIVDDSKTGRIMLKNSIPPQIAGAGEIIMKENGQEGLDAYLADKQDIVFLDLTMPVMDGYECLDKIMAHDKDAVVIIVSADIQQSAKEKVLAMGAKVMIRKPVNARTVKAIFEDFVTKAG
jgi:two-component system chemotaxis response regulator CheY